MRKVIVTAFMSLDGVTQGPGGPEEDTDGGFSCGGWSYPLSDDETGKTIDAIHDRPFDLLLGRRTYDIFSAHWPNAKGPMADKLNAATKYVATTRPESLEWDPFESLGDDAAGGVKRIKEAGGPDLIVWGSTRFMPVLLKNDLVDEFNLLIYPVALGKGKRLFSEGAPPRTLELIESKVSGKGVFINTYKPAGPVKTGSFADEYQ